MNVLHAYHVFAGAWRTPVAEHLAALEDGKFDGDLLLGVVGSREDCGLVMGEFAHLRPPVHTALAEDGWEQVTLRSAHQIAKSGRYDAILYAHTKGAANVRLFQDQWRQHMTHHLVLNWKKARDVLASGHYDAVGCHWLTKEEFGHVQADTNFPMFGGNFWMATCEYIRSLPEPPMNTRHEAESWIGLNNPRVMDFSPGWPGQVPYTRRKMRRLSATPIF